jgi:hypothetical protein
MKQAKAFPKSYNGTDGMTLRDYFAAATLQGILAGSGDEEGLVQYNADALARQVYFMADAMLKARGHD